MSPRADYLGLCSGLNPAMAYPSMAGAPVLPPEAYSYDPARDDPLIDAYEARIAYGGPSVGEFSEWELQHQYA